MMKSKTKMAAILLAVFSITAVFSLPTYAAENCLFINKAKREFKNEQPSMEACSSSCAMNMATYCTYNGTQIRNPVTKPSGVMPIAPKSAAPATPTTPTTLGMNNANPVVDGQDFTISTTQMIRYGKDSTWIAKSFSAGTYKCLPSSFDGRDPVPGVQKSCQIAPSGTVATPVANAAALAVDGGSFTLNAPTMIRYGKDSTWITKSFPAGRVVCLPASFDGRDPVPGVQKSCQVAP